MKEPSPRPGLALRCNDLMRSIAGLTRGVDSEWLGLDMGMGQFKALIVLKELGRQTVGGVARALRITEPSASLLLDKLVTRGLVARETDLEDRRRTFVALSTPGDELMTRLRRSKDDHFIGWLGRLSEDDLRALEKGLAALRSVIVGEGEGTSPTGPGLAPGPGEARS
jgi:DNA-binding MarR family transcriptional regulator